jgi:hypothetical protein
MRVKAKEGREARMRRVVRKNRRGDGPLPVRRIKEKTTRKRGQGKGNHQRTQASYETQSVNDV